MHIKTKMSRWRATVPAVLSILLLTTAVSMELIQPLAGSTFRSSAAVLWHAGNFRYLDSMSADLVPFVEALPHPNQGNYGKLSNTRKANFNALLDALFAAIDASLIDGNTGDWCAVRTRAAAAGYNVTRFYDTSSGRWFVHGYDTSSFGQAYFFI